MSEKYTVRVTARKNKLSKKTGEIPIVIRITKDRESTEKTLFRIKPEYWDEDNQRVRKSHPNSIDRNNLIRERLAKYDSVAYKSVQASSSMGVETIRDKIKNKISLDYMEYADHQIQKMYDEGNFSMYKRDKSILTDFKNFTKKKSLTLYKFTPKLVDEFETYLLVKKENKRNTVTGKIKRLRKYAKDLFIENNLDFRDFPFRNYKTKTEDTVRVFLTEREFRKIVRYKAICKRANPLRSSLNLFLIECYTGLRISDILTLKWKHYQDGLIRKKMEKTNNLISILISEVDIADKIIEGRYRKAIRRNKQLNPEAYVFDILSEDIDKASPHERHNAISSATAKINKDLKELAKNTNITKTLSTHVARHMTFSNSLNMSMLKDYSNQQVTI